MGPSSAYRSPRYFCKVSGGLAKTKSEKQLEEEENVKGMKTQLYQEFFKVWDEDISQQVEAVLLLTFTCFWAIAQC